jgi:hypothetical protein
MKQCPSANSATESARVVLAPRLASSYYECYRHLKYLIQAQDRNLSNQKKLKAAAHYLNTSHRKHSPSNKYSYPILFPLSHIHSSAMAGTSHGCSICPLFFPTATWSDLQYVLPHWHITRTVHMTRPLKGRLIDGTWRHSPAKDHGCRHDILREEELGIRLSFLRIKRSVLL